MKKSLSTIFSKFSMTPRRILSVLLTAAICISLLAMTTSIAGYADTTSQYTLHPGQGAGVNWLSVRDNISGTQYGTFCSHPKLAGSGPPSPFVMFYNDERGHNPILQSILGATGMNAAYFSEMRYCLTYGYTNALMDTQAVYWAYLNLRRPDIFDNFAGYPLTGAETGRWFSSDAATLGGTAIPGGQTIQVGDTCPVGAYYHNSRYTNTMITSDDGVTAGPFRLAFDLTDPAFSRALLQINHGAGKDRAPELLLRGPSCRFYADDTFSVPVTSVRMGEEFYVKYTGPAEPGGREISIRADAALPLTTKVVADRFFYADLAQYQYTLDLRTFEQQTFRVSFTGTDNPEPEAARPSAKKDAAQYNGTDAGGEYADILRRDSGAGALWRTTVHTNESGPVILKYGYPDYELRDGIDGVVRAGGAEELRAAITADPAAKIRLTADLDMTGQEPLPEFSGILDGQGHRIYNYTTAGDPFFAALSGAVLYKTRFEQFTMNRPDGKTEPGAVLAAAADGLIIRNCAFTDFSYSGGGSGALLFGTVSNSYFSGITLHGKLTGGPNAGYFLSAVLKDSTVTDFTVLSGSEMSGSSDMSVIGQFENSFLYNARIQPGVVFRGTNANYCGFVLARNPLPGRNGSVVERCGNYATLTGSFKSIQGIGISARGYNTFRRCYVELDTSGVTFASRIAGICRFDQSGTDNGLIDQCYVKWNDARANGFAAGILYTQGGHGTVSNCLTAGTLHADGDLAGILSLSAADTAPAAGVTVENCLFILNDIPLFIYADEWDGAYVSPDTLQGHDAAGYLAESGWDIDESGSKIWKTREDDYPALSECGYADTQVVYVHEEYPGRPDAADRQVYENGEFLPVSASVYSADWFYPHTGPTGEEVHIYLDGTVDTAFTWYTLDPDLPAGRYRGSLYITPERGFDWPGDEDDAWVEIIQKTTRLNIIKMLLDNNSQTAMDGCVFTLTAYPNMSFSGEPAAVKTIRPSTFSGETFDLDLRPGYSYRIEEAETPEGFKINEGKSWYILYGAGIQIFRNQALTDQIPAGEFGRIPGGDESAVTSSFKVYNLPDGGSPRSRLRVYQYDETGENRIDGEYIGEKVGETAHGDDVLVSRWNGAVYTVLRSNADFSVRGEAYGYPLICNDERYNFIDLVPGRYILTAFRPPAGYALDPTEYRITVGENGTVTMDDRHDPLADQAGYLPGLQNLAAGQFPSPMLDPVTGEAVNTLTVHTKSKRPEYLLHIQKIDGNTGDSLSGVAFTVAGADGTAYAAAQFHTDSSGIADIPFPYADGSYRISETGPLSGYEPVPDYLVRCAGGTMTVSGGPDSLENIMIRQGGYAFYEHEGADTLFAPDQLDAIRLRPVDSAAVSGIIGRAEAVLTAKNFLRRLILLKDDVDGTAEDLTATFAVYDKNTSFITNPLSTYLTGQTPPPELSLPYGTFYMTEIMQPGGYMPAPQEYTITHNAENGYIITGGPRYSVGGSSMTAVLEPAGDGVYTLRVKNQKDTREDTRVVIRKRVLNQFGSIPGEEDYRRAGLEIAQPVTVSVMITDVSTGRGYSGSFEYREGQTAANYMEFVGLPFGTYRVDEISVPHFDMSRTALSFSPAASDSWSSAFDNETKYFTLTKPSETRAMESDSQITLDLTGYLRDRGFGKVEQAKNLFSLDPHAVADPYASIRVSFFRKNEQPLEDGYTFSFKVLPPEGTAPLKFNYDAPTDSYTLNITGSGSETVTLSRGSVLLRGLKESGSYTVVILGGSLPPGMRAGFYPAEGSPLSDSSTVPVIPGERLTVKGYCDDDGQF
ncbi:MAG: prealbumin-like fold domain-containing protein [Oscillospiraceae bacterium]|nr:prealbumin-like fold domain-containing protein [Oscillospiraceae bacterium]